MEQRLLKLLGVGALTALSAISATAAPRRVTRVLPRRPVAVVQPTSTPDVALIGVTELNGQSQAWLLDMRTGQRERVNPGGSAFGFRLKQVANDTAILTQNGRTFTVRMGDKSVPEAKPRVVTTLPAGSGGALPGVTGGTFPNLRRSSAPPLLTPQGEVPLTPQDAGSTSPAPGSSGQLEVVPNPLPAGPQPNPAPTYPGYLVPGYGYSGYDQYGNPVYGYPGYYGGYDPSLYQYGYPGYAGYPGYPGDSGLAPFGRGQNPAVPNGPYAQPNMSGTGPQSGGLRYNPQTRRRTNDPSQPGSYVNPQTRRRRGY